MKSFATSGREFPKGAALFTGAFFIGGLTPAAALGANDRIRFGVIGCGGMATGHLCSLVKRSEGENIKGVAASDVYRRRLSRAQSVRERITSV